METISAPVDAFLTRHGMDPARSDPAESTPRFLEEMERGLAGASSSVLMLPTYLTGEGVVPQEEPVIVLDVGGTNFRVALVTITRGEPCIENLRVFPMPGSQASVTWDQFIDTVADSVLPLTGRSRRVGLCFSYTTEILPNRDGRVLSLSKQVRIVGAEGKLLGCALTDALADRGVFGVRVTVLNDGAAALLGGMAEQSGERFDGRFSLIYGTGVNTCCSVPASRISRLAVPWRGDMLVNPESGGFNRVEQGEYDRALDAASTDPGKALYEKMVSGRYEGEVILRTLRGAAAEGLLSGQLSRRLAALDQLTLAQVSAYADRPYGGGVLAAACATEEDRETVYTVIDRSVQRCANLVCANLAALLELTDTGRSLHRPACVVAEGSTFDKSHLFRSKLEHVCTTYVTDMLGRRLVFRQVNHVNLVGTAAAVLMNT
ncbi:MAG: hypothetical protein LKK00_08745 [Intestinimonas sp.]|jgi:hexokinase|nr:hypothetical protein [Intestinimonas sp.]